METIQELKKCADNIIEKWNKEYENIAKQKSILDDNEKLYQEKIAARIKRLKEQRDSWDTWS